MNQNEKNNFNIFFIISFILLIFLSFFLFKNNIKNLNNEYIKFNKINYIEELNNIINQKIEKNNGNLYLAKEKKSSYNIYDINGKLLATLIPEKFISKKEYDISSPEVISLINIEDKNFFNREEIINIKGFIRALYYTLKGDKQGGSGITQQLIKNTFLKNEETIGRKINELIYTYNLEKKYSKIELINFYLNNISYGKNVLGIQQAGEVFLGKTELNLEDCFVLNSLLKKPTYFSNNQDKLKERAIYYYNDYCKYNYCGNLEDGIKYINNISLKYKLKNTRIGNDYIIDMISDLINNNKIDKTNSGLVLNYIENDNKEKVDKLIYLEKQNICKKYNVCDIGALVMNKDGYLEYLYSGEYENNKINYLNTLLQPGSTLKPFIYTKYFEKNNITSEYSTISNSKICIGNWCPSNWNNSSSKSINFQTAINLSYNLPVLHMYKNIGHSNTLDLFKKIGIFDKNQSNIGSSFIIGGYNVNLISLANAYRIFLNGGIYKPFNIIKEKDNDKGIRIYEQKYSDLMKKILINTTDYKGIYGVKTGTTNNFKDELIVLFNNDKIILIWGGNRDGKPTKYGYYAVKKLGGVLKILIDNYLK